MKKAGFFRSIQLKFIIIYILLILVAVQVIGSYFARALEEDLTESFKESVNDRVDLLSYNLEQAFNKERSEDDQEPTLENEVQEIISDIDTDTFTNLLIIDNQSRVLGTNDFQNYDILGKKIVEEDVQKALLFGSPIDNVLYDSKTDNQVFIKIEPIYNGDENVTGVVYVVASLEGVHRQLQNINDIFLKGSIWAITVSALIGILVARTITKPIIEMRRQAQMMARGDFTQKVKVYGTDEISHLAETFNDLNDRLKHSLASTEKEQRKLSSVLANMTEGVIATDMEGKITLMNDAAGKLLNRNPDILMGDYLLDTLEISERIVHISDLQESGSILIDLSDDNNIFLVRAAFSTIYDEYDQITGFITVLTDVTEQEKVEQERREFVSNVSHELRTPLTTMRSYLEALADGTWQDEELAPKFLKVTQNETERMIRLVSDLFQLSRMDHKEDTLQRQRMELISFLHQIIDRFEMNITAEIELTREFPEGPYYVWIDEDKMTQILDNIIANAIKYSPEGGSIVCRVSMYDRNAQQILIEVEDEGIGIPFETKDKIFDRFYRADKARTRRLGGSGLGLAITKELVEAHYGKIWVESIEGKGTTFLVTLPLMKQNRRKRV